MRHRRNFRRFRRTASHRKAMLRNMACSLFLTERDAEGENNAPKVKGRVITTLPKAKELRPIVEKCITLATKSLEHAAEAEQYATRAKRDSEEWRKWRSSDQWLKWSQARAPVVTARRRAMQILGDKTAVRVLFEEIAPRFASREGGYTRVLKLAKPRLGDAGARAILEFVGVRDRVIAKSEKPAFSEPAATSTSEPEAAPSAPSPETAAPPASEDGTKS